MKSTIEPDKLAQMTPEELIELWSQTGITLEEFIAQRDAIKTELDSRLQNLGQKSQEWAGHIVTRFPKVYFNKVTLETARQYAATEMTEPKEIVNTTILKKLIEAGKEIEGAEVRVETRIAPVRRQEGEEA